MLKVIVFNGPARSGKDSASSYMSKIKGNSYHLAFKDELFKICANTLGTSVTDFLDGYDETVEDYSYRTGWDERYSFQDVYNDYDGDYLRYMKSWMKDLSWYELNGKDYSKREFLIHMSENVIKPSFGKDAFGKAFVNSLPEDGIVFVSDSGFPEELQPVIEHVGEENVLVIRIQRESCSFEGDSRDYLTPEMFDDKVQFYQITNNGTEEEFQEGVEELVEMWLNAED